MEHGSTAKKDRKSIPFASLYFEKIVGHAFPGLMKQNGMFERYAVAKTWSARAARELSEGGRPERDPEGNVGDLPRTDGARAWRSFLMREDL